MKDTFKMTTTLDWSAWDLNSKYAKTDRKLQKIFKRKARRKLKQGIDKYDYI